MAASCIYTESNVLLYCSGHYSLFLTESSKSPASIAKSNKQLFGYEQVAKRIANIRLTRMRNRMRMVKIYSTKKST